MRYADYYRCSVPDPFTIRKVYFNDPVTVVMWEDGTKTIVRRDECDAYDPEKALAMAISKKALGNKGKYYDIFKKWIPEEEEEEEEYDWLSTLISKIDSIVISKIDSIVK